MSPQGKADTDQSGPLRKLGFTALGLTVLVCGLLYVNGASAPGPASSDTASARPGQVGVTDVVPLSAPADADAARPTGEVASFAPAVALRPTARPISEPEPVLLEPVLPEPVLAAPPESTIPSVIPPGEAPGQTPGLPTAPAAAPAEEWSLIELITSGTVAALRGDGGASEGQGLDGELVRFVQDAIGQGQTAEGLEQLLTTAQRNRVVDVPPNFVRPDGRVDAAAVLAAVAGAN
ncbi:hypothetical protein [Candidatus Rhodobacter oscarellae]|uniref:hypothetical protein n=1 Tax=Candidatus Rhodobacter oscarellae TaxID=1675527 RepID=UPI000671352C|nr:hypothetical protein [Candidatus Rhodobacter lobularis]